MHCRLSMSYPAHGCLVRRETIPKQMNYIITEYKLNVFSPMCPLEQLNFRIRVKVKIALFPCCKCIAAYLVLFVTKEVCEKSATSFAASLQSFQKL